MTIVFSAKIIVLLVAASIAAAGISLTEMAPDQ
jgi:hypothetical protein